MVTVELPTCLNFCLPLYWALSRLAPRPPSGHAQLTNCASLPCVAQPHCTHTQSPIRSPIEHISPPSNRTLVFLCQHPLLPPSPCCFQDYKNWGVPAGLGQDMVHSTHAAEKGNSLEFLRMSEYLSRKLQGIEQKHEGTEVAMIVPAPHATQLPTPSPAH